jgi:hypothetical protein
MIINNNNNNDADNNNNEVYFNKLKLNLLGIGERYQGSNPQTLRIQSGREQAQKYIKTMREGMGYRGNDFLLPLKKYGHVNKPLTYHDNS